MQQEHEEVSDDEISQQRESLNLEEGENVKPFLAFIQLFSDNMAAMLKLSDFVSCRTHSIFLNVSTK